MKAINIIIVLLISSSIHAQVGSWHYYFGSKHYRDIETIGDDIYINGQRALFQMKSSTDEINQWNPITGLANYAMATMKYNPLNKKLLIAYDNQAIDVIDFATGSKTIIPNYDITNKILIADKSINQIKFIDSFAYICSNIGIIVFNFTKNEINASYIIGQNGQYKKVNSIEKYGSTLYALTDSGIMTAQDIPALNLQDYHNWNYNLNFNSTQYLKSELNQNTLYLMASHSLYQYSNGVASTIMAEDTTIQFINLRQLDNKIFVIYQQLDSNKNSISTEVKEWANGTLVPFLSSPKDPVYDIAKSKEGDYYLTGRYIFKKNGTALDIIPTEKLPFDNAFRIQEENSHLFFNIGVMSSNLETNLVQDGMFELNWDRGNNFWSQNAYWDAPSHNLYNQMAGISAHGGFYRAFNRGGISFEKNGTTTVFNNSNSILETWNDEIRIVDMKLNPIDNTIWILNNHAKKPLVSISADGTWRSHDLSSVIATNEFRQLEIDQIGNKWISSRQNGVVLFNEQTITNTSDDIMKLYTNITTYNFKKIKECDLDISVTNDMSVDREGNLWVASNKGLGIISNCTFDPKAECTYSIPILNTATAKDTNSYVECIFLNTAVSAIAFDGGNNLWAGTDAGAFYNIEYGSISALNITELNSPLYTKSIFDIKVNPKSGEVFFTTDVGVLGYMGQSTDATVVETSNPYFVTPNPVPKDYQGLISIDGLPENAFYKITDVLGNLMYQGNANGSRVTWDGRTMQGIRVPTGVYFIFSGKSMLQGASGIGKFTVLN